MSITFSILNYNYYITVIVFGIITLILFITLSRPTVARNGNTGTRTTDSATSTTTTSTRQQASASTSTTGSTTGINTPPSSVGSTKIYEKATRVPDHVSITSSQITLTNGSNILSDGIVSFRYTKAAVADEEELLLIHQQQQQQQLIIKKQQIEKEENINSNQHLTRNKDIVDINQTQIVELQQHYQQQPQQQHEEEVVKQKQELIQKEIRKDRVRILSRLLDETVNGGISIVSPPTKGCTIVLSIPIHDCSCIKLRRILYVLCLSYTVFVIIVVDTNNSNNDKITNNNNQFTNKDRISTINKLRGITTLDSDTGSNKDTVQVSTNVTTTYKDDNNFILSSTILPSHRIVASTTISGRVAFVRQLDRVDIIIDYNIEVKQLLSRFGHKVHIFSTASTGKVTAKGGIQTKYTNDNNSTTGSNNANKDTTTTTTTVSILGSVLL